MRISAETPIDLQLHTTYSDGRWTAEELFEHLSANGFGLVAVTDHDRVDTVIDILQTGGRRHVPVVPAVEISAEYRGQMADLLCFGIDPHDQGLRAIVDDVRQRQKANAEDVFKELLHRGYTLPQPATLRVAGDCGALLMELGYVADWASALTLITAAGYRKMKADIHQTIEVVHRSGGVALIAHPGRGLHEPEEFTYYTPELLDQVRAETALDGIEVFYPTHTAEQQETYLAYTRQHNLLISAGSDSHGPPGRLPIKYPARLCRRLLERLNIEIV